MKSEDTNKVGDAKRNMSSCMDWSQLENTLDNVNTDEYLNTSWLTENNDEYKRIQNLWMKVKFDLNFDKVQWRELDLYQSENWSVVWHPREKNP